MWPWERERDFNNRYEDLLKQRESARRARARNPEININCCKRYRERHPEQHQNWRKRNPDKVKEYLRRQYQTEEHRTYMREYMRKYRAAGKANNKKRSDDPAAE